MQTNQNPVTVIDKGKSMLNNANELKNVSSEKLEKPLKEQNFLKDNDIINFSVEDNMLWKKFLVYSEV